MAVLLILKRQYIGSKNSFNSIVLAMTIFHGRLETKQKKKSDFIGYSHSLVFGCLTILQDIVWHPLSRMSVKPKLNQIDSSTLHQK